MSRVRFHAVQAIGKICNVLWSGPGWDNWNDYLPARDNIEQLYKNSPPPDLVLCYKVDEISGLADIKQPSAVNRDELDTEDNTAEEAVRKFTQHKIDLVISHQMRQMDNPLLKTLPCHMAYIPYCANSFIFKDYAEEKTIDLLLIGNLAAARYPLRAKLHNYLLKMRQDPRYKELNIEIYPYPGYRLETAYDEAHVINFAKLINRSKICLTCSGKYHLKYAKYVEVAACHSLLMADMPGEDQEILKQYLAEISPHISYSEFTEKIEHYLYDTKIRMELTERGYSIVKTNFTQERYARDFVAIVEDYLNIYGHQKIWN